MRASKITIASEPADSARADWCLERYFEFLNERFEDGYDPAQGQPTRPDEFTPPNGVFLIAILGDALVGCGALKSAGPAVGEIKRLWVAHSARGQGLGQQLLSALEDEARKLGMESIHLDTNRSLTEAQALYEKNGYVEVSCFNDDPYPDYYFEKKLDQDGVT